MVKFEALWQARIENVTLMVRLDSIPANTHPKLEIGSDDGNLKVIIVHRITRLLNSALLLLFGLTGFCPGAVAAETKRLVVGVSLLTMTNPFFRQLGDAMKDEGAKHRMEVLLSSGEFDSAKQRNQVSDFIARHVDAIVLSPCDSKAIGTSIAEANKAGIPVFTADIAALVPGVRVESHIATDNLGGGKLAAQALIEALGGNGKVAIIEHPEVESAILRTKGFEEELARQKKERGITLQIVAKLPGGGVKDKSFKAVEDLMQ